MKPAITLLAASKLPSLTCQMRAPNGLRSRVERADLDHAGRWVLTKEFAEDYAAHPKSIASKANAVASAAIGG